MHAVRNPSPLTCLLLFFSFSVAFLLRAIWNLFSPRPRYASQPINIINDNIDGIHFRTDMACKCPSTLQAFGIDDNRLILAALAPSFLIFPLYLRWSSQQERDDFFDGYEKRRQG